MQWYNKLNGDMLHLPAFLNYCDAQLAEAKKEVKIGGILEMNISALPGITEHRFNQLQEVEAVLGLLNLQLTRIRTPIYRAYLEKYGRALTSRDAGIYTDGESDVLDHQELVNEVALRRNTYLGIMKGLEAKNFMVGHIAKIRTAGMEDITL